MADVTKNEGQPNTGGTAINTPGSATDRVAITCPATSPHTFKFKSSEVTVEKLRIAFGIKSAMKFFLVDEENNIEFASDAQYFQVHTDRVYKVLLSDVTGVNEEQKNDADAEPDVTAGFGAERKVSISVVGNEDGRSTGKGFHLTAHGSMQRDRRDAASSYVIAHRDATKVGIWKLHAYGQKQRNLFKIQLLKVSDGRAQGRNRWLAVHGSVAKDKRDAASIYAMITDEAQKASIWELVRSPNNQSNVFVIRLHGNVDGRTVGIDYKMAIHDSNQLDRRDGASLVVHARNGNPKAFGTLFKIEKY